MPVAPRPAPDDSFALQSGGDEATGLILDKAVEGDFSDYSPDAFFHRAISGGAARSFQVSGFSISSTVQRGLDIVMSSGQFPYRAKSDAYRNWLMHGLIRDLMRMDAGHSDEELNKVVNELMQLAIEQEAQRQQDYLVHFERTLAKLRTQRDREGFEQAVKLARQYPLKPALAAKRDEIISKMQRTEHEPVNPEW
jgi:hypothetical protein